VVEKGTTIMVPSTRAAGGKNLLAWPGVDLLCR